MNVSNSSFTQKCNDYLSDSLSEKEKTNFEEKLKKDKKLADSFENHKQILEGMTSARRAYFQLYRDIEGEQPYSKSNRKFALWLIWIFVLLVLGTAIWAVLELF